ncbi:MAG: alpha/beta hydrolase [Rhodospirillaceae bacterium]|nr:alpha/beta hydrolase [Rhodospirillaceae bacterium]
MHVLEAGFETSGRPAVLLLHGFPELAYSWRKVIPVLADAGYYVIAPDLRGYGRTIGWGPVTYDDPLDQFRLLNAVRDTVGLLQACELREVAAVVGHDYGSSVAAWSALVRPEMFRTCVLMSAPFDGPPELSHVIETLPNTSTPDIHKTLAALKRPRKHYHWYYSTRPANADMTDCPEGIHAFLRAYYHHKSADWKSNKPHRLKAWRADQLALMPTYYIMDLDETMPEAVAKEMPDANEISSNSWLTDDELAVYTAEYTRNGFQGGLNWYRRGTLDFDTSELQTFAGRTIDQPSCFISGSSDWGVYQRPNAAERMNGTSCTDMRGVHLIDGAGHWVQQEQPEETCRVLLDFLKDASE